MPHQSSPSPSITHEDVEIKGARILIVDDNAQNRELLQAYLEPLQCSVETAADGLIAVEAIERGHPDIILLDVMMPNMSGFELCAKIKGEPSTRDIPVVMVTALNEISDVERAVECGTDDFLTKPVNKLELVTRVKSLLRLRLLKRELSQTLSRIDQIERGRPTPDEG
jgi:two-component system alkaline phosphatase synthesis response regulator PhoP